MKPCFVGKNLTIHVNTQKENNQQEVEPADTTSDRSDGPKHQMTELPGVLLYYA